MPTPRSTYVTATGFELHVSECGERDRPPLVMGEMRKELHKEVEQRLVGEVPKTLTNHTVDEIEKILSSG